MAKKKKKSEKLTPVERKTLKEFYNSYTYASHCASALKINRSTLMRIVHYGSGSQKLINKIRKKIA